SLCEAPAGGQRERGVVGFHLIRDGGVIGCGGDDGDIVEVLGSAANHAGAADVDVLDDVGEGYAGLRGSLFEGVEVHDDHVDRLDGVLGNCCDVLRVVADV